MPDDALLAPVKVLVVDDDLAMCEMLASHLATRGMGVAVRSSAGDALAAAEAEDFDVVITDVRMRDLDGVELCRQLIEHQPVLPVIVITAFGTMETAIQAIRAGIEGLAARLGARRIDERGLGRMAELLGVLRSAAGRRDLDQFLRIATEFEDECYRAAGQPRLLNLVQGHRQAAQRYVRLALGDSPDFEVAFHERFFAAASAHDGPAAESIIREALAWTLERLTRKLTAAEAPLGPATADALSTPSADPLHA